MHDFRYNKFFVFLKIYIYINIDQVIFFLNYSIIFVYFLGNISRKRFIVIDLIFYFFFIPETTEGWKFSDVMSGE